MTGFDDPDTVARYADNPPRLVPGFHDLLLTLHFLPAEKRLATLREIRRRLMPGAAFVEVPSR